MKTDLPLGLLFGCTTLAEAEPRVGIRVKQRRHDAAIAHDEGAGETSIADDKLLVNPT